MRLDVSGVMVADLLTGFVSEDWVHTVDLDTLDKCNGSYVSDDLRDRQDDIVWRVRRGDEVACVYLLLEFQSSADAWMALLNRYGWQSAI